MDRFADVARQLPAQMLGKHGGEHDGHVLRDQDREAVERRPAVLQQIEDGVGPAGGGADRQDARF